MTSVLQHPGYISGIWIHKAISADVRKQIWNIFASVYRSADAYGCSAAATGVVCAFKDKVVRVVDAGAPDTLIKQLGEIREAVIDESNIPLTILAQSMKPDYVVPNDTTLIPPVLATSKELPPVAVCLDGKLSDVFKLRNKFSVEVDGNDTLGVWPLGQCYSKATAYKEAKERIDYLQEIREALSGNFTSIAIHGDGSWDAIGDTLHTLILSCIPELGEVVFFTSSSELLKEVSTTYKIHLTCFPEVVRKLDIAQVEVKPRGAFFGAVGADGGSIRWRLTGG